LFLFVDRILEFEPGKRALGVSHVTSNAAFLRGEGSGGGSVPSCLIGEALGQLGAWVVMEANGFTLRPVAGLVGAVEIFGQARAGDPLLLHTTIDSLNEDSVVYHAVATVRGAKILTLENSLGPLLPMEQFSDAAQVREQFLAIRPDASGPSLPVEAPPVTNRDGAESPDYSFDRIVSRQSGKEVVALKNIDGSARYFIDHFPRKPVFPLSLLLQCLLELGQELLTEDSGAHAPRQLRPVALRNVKMSQFVHPGESLLATVRVKERSDARARLGFRCELDGRRVCIAEAEFAATAEAAQPLPL
jgi:3-hydroxymyristoyl/3-hydroxydecanoyl-(acyl carrier protein) dehydratase